MTDISVIIPVYNVAQDMFERCVKSLENQTYTNYEVIIIDDGSKDELSEKYKSICDTYSNIIYVKQENRGVSSARNHGMSIAKGEYIAYVDADDVVYPDYLTEAYDIAVSKHADFVIGGIMDFVNNEPMYGVKTGTGKIVEYADNLSHLNRYMMGYRKYEFEFGRIDQGPWARLIKTSLNRKCLFDENLKIGEDVVWNLQVIANAERICVVESVWYGYYINPESSSRRYREGAADESLESLNKMLSLVDLDDDEQYMAFCRRCIGDLNRIYRCFVQYLPSGDDKREKIIRKLYNEDPWNLIATKRFLKLCKKKEKKIYFLYITKHFFDYLRIRDFIKSRI